MLRCGGFRRRAAAAAAAVLVALVRPAAGQGSEPPAGPDAPQATASGPFSLWRPAPLTEPLATDRPDFTETTDAVPAGHLQVEGGYTFSYDREGRNKGEAHTAPELLLRVGLVQDFEFRLGWEGYTWLDETSEGRSRAGRRVLFDDASSGASDLSVGFKYKFFEQDGLRPHLGAIAALTLPTGSDGFSSDDVDPEVKLLWAYDLSEHTSVAGNVNFAVPTEDSERFFQSSASISLFHGLTDDVGAYFEYFGFYPGAHDTDCANYLNGGFTWLITENLQLDWRAGFGLNEEADDFFTGAGFGIRF